VLPVRKIEKPRARSAAPNATDIQDILRRILKSLERKDTELIPPYNRGLGIDPEADDPTYKLPSDVGITVSNAQAFMNALMIAYPIGPGPEVSFVKMVLWGATPVRYRFADGNGIYPFRGRGPVWKNNSCAFDACIVAGMFLNAGSTTADKGTESRTSWMASLTVLQRTFLDMINLDWRSIRSDQSIERRDIFIDMYLRTLNATLSPTSKAPELKRGNFMPAVTVWELSTMNFHQFTFLTRRFANMCMSCGERNEPPGRNVPESSVAIEIRGHELNESPPPTFGRLMRNYFGWTPMKDCTKCKAVGKRFRRRLIVGDLPPRLVVQPNLDYKHMPGYASDEVSFSYEDLEGTERQATYRWLGGIYMQNQHFRTYWNDSKVGDQRKLLRLYDGQHTGGIIIGGIEPRASDDPENKDQRIIDENWENGTILLFYERTDNPVVESVCAVLQKAADDLGKDQPADDGGNQPAGDGGNPPGGDGGAPSAGDGGNQPGGDGGNQPGGDGGNQPGGDGGNPPGGDGGAPPAGDSGNQPGGDGGNQPGGDGGAPPAGDGGDQGGDGKQGGDKKQDNGVIVID